MPSFPPIIEGKLPAQAGRTLRIPFQNNPTVSQNNTNFTIKISQLVSGTEVFSLSSQNCNDFTIVNNCLIFIDNSISDNLIKSQFYKLQVAYSGSPYYSNVGIFKYLGAVAPTASIEPYNVEQEGFLAIVNITDETESLFSYTFILENQDTGFIINSNEILYTNQDSNNEYQCQFNPSVGLPDGQYKIKFTYKTINGFEPASEIFTYNTFKGNQTLSDKIIIEDIDNLDKGKCYIKFDNSTHQNCRLLRQSNSIIEILTDYTTSSIIYNDFTYSNNIYIYKIQTAYEVDSIDTTKIQYSYRASEPVFTDLEHIFLSDNDKQLCVKLNPKVSSFKENIKETKQETLGGKYPFFFRSGDTNYKEFSINGLISYHMDNDLLFMRNDNPYDMETSQRSRTVAREEDNNFYPTMNQTGYNIMYERKFREEVIKWLNNGKPKLFRSPYEGNYIVRLMNVSLTPEEQLGRMIYSFQATAYEIAECTLDQMRKNNCLYMGVGRNDV